MAFFRRWHPPEWSLCYSSGRWMYSVPYPVSRFRTLENPNGVTESRKVAIGKVREGQGGCDAAAVDMYPFHFETQSSTARWLISQSYIRV